MFLAVPTRNLPSDLIDYIVHHRFHPIWCEDYSKCSCIRTGL